MSRPIHDLARHRRATIVLGLAAAGLAAFTYGPWSGDPASAGTSHLQAAAYGPGRPGPDIGVASAATPVPTAAAARPTLPEPKALVSALVLDEPAPRAARSGGGGAPSSSRSPSTGSVPSPEPVAPAPAPAPPASPAPGAASQALSMLNGYRAANGLAPLSGAGDAMAKAQAHAEDMAASGSIWHSNLASGISGWSALAENVGFGPSASAVHSGFVNSSVHSANMLGDFTDVGVGAAVGADGNLYVCEVFVAR